MSPCQGFERVRGGRKYVTTVTVSDSAPAALAAIFGGGMQKVLAEAGWGEQGKSERRSDDPPSRDSDLTRRELLKIGLAASAGALVGSQVEAAQVGTREKLLPVVMLWLEGGGDPWRSFMPLDQHYSDLYRGPFPAIDTCIPGVRVTSLFPNFARILNKVSFIRSVTSDSHDHFVSTDRLLLDGDRTLGDRLGSRATEADLGYSIINMEGRYQNDPPTLEGHRKHTALEFTWNPEQKRIPKPTMDSAPRLPARRDLLGKLDRFQYDAEIVRRMEGHRDRAMNLFLGKPKYLEAFDIPDEELKRFGEKGEEQPNQLAHAAALASGLAQRGVAFTTIHHCERQGWDMHGNLPTELPILGGHLDVALPQLVIDAYRHGFLVICTSEFGRTPQMNSLEQSGGSDHHDVHYFFGAGGGFKEGAIYGDYTKDGQIKDKPVRNEELGPTIIRAAGGKVDGMNRGVDAVLKTS